MVNRDLNASVIQQVVEQILRMFTPDELRRVVHGHHSHIEYDLREGSSPREYVENLISLLSRRRELDERFFSVLRGARPWCTTEIDALSALVSPRNANTETEVTPFDAAIADVKTRIATLERDGLEARCEKDELRKLSRRRRAYPAPIRGACLAGRYTLDAELGQGGFASVWRAFDREAHRMVALKILHNHHATDRTRRDRFARGMRTMRSLDHPNILRVNEPTVNSNGLIFSVLELISGGDLQQSLLHSRTSRDQVWPILLAVCDALAHVHHRGFIHRDIKPSNILLTDSGAPLLTDFDLVLDYEGTGVTRTGAFGTVLYTAPELWVNAAAATPSADVYSLAMTAVFALIGTPLSPHILRNLNHVLEDLTMSTALRDVLRRALAWEIEDRYPNAKEFSDALTHALARPVSRMGVQDDHDLLYWIADERGRAETVWLTETDGKATVVARTPGIALTAGTRVWRLSRDIRQVSGCASKDFKSYETVSIDVDAADLIEIDGAQRIPLGFVKDPTDTSIPVGAPLNWPDECGFEQLEHSVTFLFSAGPYLLIRSAQRDCYGGAAHGSFTVDFSVLDLRSGAACDLLTSEERAAISRDLAEVAEMQLNREHYTLEQQGHSQTPEGQDEPQLTMFYAHYDLEACLQLTYQFTRDTSYADSDNQWDDYTCSTRLSAPQLPASLTDLGLAPGLLQEYWQTVPHHAGSHGWTSTPRSLETRQRLRRCFDEISRTALTKQIKHQNQ